MAPSDDGESTRREYRKLVRDDIPEIVRENGETPIARVADDEEYAELLAEKLVEEADEFRESGELEELADVLAVVDAVRERRNVSEDELRKLQAEKAEDRGRFEERIVLDAVEK
ncbi:nucleoside triphosphate pyrophosphohydrolase [Natronoarchaeum mannanilyticum]|uniref:Nucleoside triphosphate pyrophosphohydrolase n=1 Tax=Natronoarchaeum mannanilyticum TaxID=926360 RepID=A0AAV3TAH9_9EURY